MSTIEELREYVKNGKSNLKHMNASYEKVTDQNDKASIKERITSVENLVKKFEGEIKELEK